MRNPTEFELMRSFREERLRQKRKNKDVSFALGIHPSSLTKLEKCQRPKIKYDFMRRYADVLGLRLELFFDVVKREEDEI